MKHSTEHQQVLEGAQKLMSRVDSPAVAIELIELVTPILLSPLVSEHVDWPAHGEASRMYAAAVCAHRHIP